MAKITRIYYVIGLLAVVSTLFASVSSFLVYAIYHEQNYLYYSIVWGIISLVDYVVWRKPPNTVKKDLEEKA